MNKPIDVDAIWKSGATEALDVAVQLKPFRSWLIARAERHLEQKFFEENRDRMYLRVQRMRKQALMNLLYSIDRGIRRRIISPHVRKRVLSTFVGNVLTGEKDRMKPFREQHGFDPPTFVTISPTKRCNLQCTGCYAGSTSSEKSTLDYETFTRIMREKREEWGSHFTVISGGEPLMYRSRGKTLLDVVSEQSDNYFLMYTNGTLITDEVARRMAELGNIVPAISVEGWEHDTDERRGRGVFRKIETAMEILRRHGVPFGISVTATRHNAETVLSDEFMDYFFDEHGAIFGWIFQYMPIGRSYTVDLMVTPEQRKWMLEREMDLLYKHDRFMIDFWNGGPMSLGCIAAGRSGGYFYIDWDGNIAPCVFFPYAVANINEIYEQGGSISDVLWSGLFTRIRAWQTDQRGNYGQSEVKNLFCPCPIRDHHQFAEQLITDHEVRPLDPDAEAAYGDAEYHRRMREYDNRLRRLLDPMWEEEFETTEEAEKERAGTM
ncbi:MAG: radical SAM/SPASM domain-containing protein [Spirochaetaceae bacterium]